MQTPTYTYTSGNSTDNYSNGIDNDSDDMVIKDRWSWQLQYDSDMISVDNDFNNDDGVENGNFIMTPNIIVTLTKVTLRFKMT